MDDFDIEHQQFEFVCGGVVRTIEKKQRNKLFFLQQF